MKWIDLKDQITGVWDTASPDYAVSTKSNLTFSLKLCSAGLL